MKHKGLIKLALNYNIYHIPPAGMTHGIGCIISTLLSRNSTDQKIFDAPAKYLYPFSSGKSALAFALNQYKKNSNNDRDEIIIPAYTCYSVPAAVEQSKLKLILCDIDHATLDFKYEMLQKLVNNKTLCIIGSHLFGLDIDLQSLIRIKNKVGAKLIEDAAQGCREEKLHDGVDARIYSFSRGKPLSTMGGGLLITNDKQRNIEEAYSKSYNPGWILSLSKIIEIIVSDVFIRPYLYWIPAMIPQLKLGQTIYPSEIVVSKMLDFQKRLYGKLKHNLTKLNSTRNKNVKYIMQYLQDSTSLRQAIWRNIKNYSPARMPVLLRTKYSDLPLKDKLNLNKLGVTQLYPLSLNNVSEIKNFWINQDDKFQSAEYLSEHLVTLPTHQWVNEEIIQLQAEILRAYLN